MAMRDAGSLPPLLVHAAAHGFDLRAARRRLRHFEALYGLAGEVLTVDFCGQQFLAELEEEASAVERGEPAEDSPRPAKRARTAPAAHEAEDEDVICITSSDEDEPRARPRPPPAPRASAPAHGRSGAAASQGRIDRFFTTPAARRPSRPAAPVREEADACEADLDRLDDLALANLKCFGNARFRPQQRAICAAVLANQDVFVLMPTGGGKSLCYQLPAVLSAGVTVVCSPLLSLIQDQVTALVHGRCDGVPASFLSSQQGAGERAAVLRELAKRRPTLKLLYVTPEQLVNGGALNNALAALAASGQLARFVIDEAHCVSQWGHSFRADYKALGLLRQRYPRVPILALTATATAPVKRDTLAILGMQRCVTFQVSFNRPNLSFAVRPKVGGAAGLAAFAAHVAETYGGVSGIIYCLSRAECAAVADALCAAGCSAVTYHAGMTPLQRASVQREWTAGRARVACATIAFGMGLDKADVRYVLHYSMPKAIEGLYQEAGRAGRDGQPAAHTVFFSAGDHARVVRLIRRGRRQAGAGSTATALRLADAVRDYCAEKAVCRRVQLMAYLGEAFTAAQCGATCDNCQRAAGTLPDGHDDFLPGAGAAGAKAARAKARAKAPRAKKGGKKGSKRAKGGAAKAGRGRGSGSKAAPQSTLFASHWPGAGS
jgi:RecQ family ATP-dependent DNA helicase